jgi:hypothetical protein
VLATLTVAVLVCAASIVVGEALARVLRLERWRGSSPAVGLALLIAVALAAVKLPGHGTTGAVVLAVVAIAATLAVARSGGIPRPPWHVTALTGTTLLAALIPYVSNGRFGIPAVGFTNDPAAHFTWINNLRSVPASEGVVAGYPVGPHSLMAALASGTGIEIDWIFCGLLVALVALIGWAALSLLDGLGPARRLLAATLVAVAYTVSAFYAQAGFKELLVTLFLIAALGIARAEARRGGATGWRSGVQVGLLCGAMVVSFSYGGLAWPVLTAALWLGATAASALLPPRRRRIRDVTPAVLDWLRRALPAGLAAIAAGALVVASDIPRLLDSVQVFGASPAGAGTIVTENIGHLAGEVSKREIFGFWAREDFRFGFDHTLQNELLGLLAIAVAGCAAIWWLWRRDLAVPAAVVAAVAIAVRLSETDSAYTASKALAPAGALVMLMSTRALLAGAPPIRLPGARWIVATVAVVFTASALWSSFLVLRGAQVGPREHTDELAELQARTGGEDVLFLGNDDYAEWQLRGSHALVLPGARHEKEWEFQHPFDFDTVDSTTIDAAPFTITTRTEYRSEPPPNLRRVHVTHSYELWKRRGPTPARGVVPGEGPRPGKMLDCSRSSERGLSRLEGWARVWAQPPRAVELPQHARSIPAGDRQGTSVFLPRGRWEMSLQYVSPRRIDVSLGDGAGGWLAPNLARPGPVWRVAEIAQRRAGRRPLVLDVEEDELGSENHPALPTAALFVRTDAPRRLVPLREACGRYVDWYTLGPKRPRV